jgi:hypothetical protein
MDGRRKLYSQDDAGCLVYPVSMSVELNAFIDWEWLAMSYREPCCLLYVLKIHSFLGPIRLMLSGTQSWGSLSKPVQHRGMFADVRYVAPLTFLQFTRTLSSYRSVWPQSTILHRLKLAAWTMVVRHWCHSPNGWGHTMISVGCRGVSARVPSSVTDMHVKLAFISRSRYFNFHVILCYVIACSVSCRFQTEFFASTGAKQMKCAAFPSAAGKWWRHQDIATIRWRTKYFTWKSVSRYCVVTVLKYECSFIVSYIFKTRPGDSRRQQQVTISELSIGIT